MADVRKNLDDNIPTLINLATTGLSFILLFVQVLALRPSIISQLEFDDL